MEHHRRLLVCFTGCSILVTGECPDDPLTLRISETTIGVVCGKRRARNLRGDTRELGYTRSQVISRSPKPFSFSNIPPDRQNSLSCPATQQTFPLKTNSSSSAKRWRQDKRSRLGRWPSCANKRTNCERITSAYEPSWRPPRLRNHRDLPAHVLHLVPIKARRLLYPTTLTYRWMTSYLLTALCSHGVHHPRTSRKPNPEKGPLINPADPSIPHNTGYGEKPVRSDASRSQLMNVPERPGGIAPPVPSMYPPFRVATTPHMFFSSALRGPQHMLSSSLDQHILDYDPPHGFSIPSFSMYDGSFDPYNHMWHFNQAMILNVRDDRLLCKVFPVSLKGPVLAWFHKLPRGSINSFVKLWASFVSQYLCSIRKKWNISSLQAILKREDDSIRDFTRRFGQAVQQIDIYSMDAIL